MRSYCFYIKIMFSDISQEIKVEQADHYEVRNIFLSMPKSGIWAWWFCLVFHLFKVYHLFD